MARVFVVEDNDGLRETVVSYLRLEQHEVVAFSRLAGLEDAIRMQAPEVIILDVMLPDGDGFLFARRLREFCRSPIIFLTARTGESDRITGFEVGGDDYVVKPFSNKELMLRVKAMLRRSQADDTRSAEGGRRYRLTATAGHGHEHDHELELDEQGHVCRHDGLELSLTAAEWKILSHLADHPAIVVSRERLLGVCLDYLAEGSERTIDTHIKNIRLKLAKAPWIDTVRGFGYRFAGREAPAALHASAGGRSTGGDREAERDRDRNSD